MRALIIDDQPLIVSGLQTVMASLQTPVVTSCAESPDAARRLLASDMHFDLVRLDLDLAGSGGLNFGERRAAAAQLHSCKAYRHSTANKTPNLN
jgi:DNA-binding NarL/FixJ family response regulator